MVSIVAHLLFDGIGVLDEQKRRKPAPISASGQTSRRARGLFLDMNNKWSSVAFVVASCFCIGSVSSPARAQVVPPNAPSPSGVTVSGLGEVRVKPDIARLDLGVQTQNRDARRAASFNAIRAGRIIAAVRATGVAARDIQTTGYYLAPQYQYNNRTGKPTFIGYEVSNEVRVTVRALSDAGRVLDAAIRAGANTSSGVSFDLKDRNTARDAALRIAAADASRKARVVAAAFGLGSIRLLSVNENNTDAPREFANNAATLSSSAAPTPINAGEITVSASISATYGFGGAR